MDSTPKPDLALAARQLDQAHTLIKQAVIGILRPDGSEALWSVAGQLGKIAEHFKEGRLLIGLRVELVDSKTGARAMGRVSSDKKLAALAKAREVLAQKRSLAGLKRRRS